MAGDGVYLWYWGRGEEPECFYDGSATGDEAMAKARADSPEGGYSIVEADKTIPSTECFDAGQVLEAFEEHNEECWGEDGAPTAATDAQRRELEHKLADCLGRWLKKHGLGKAYNFNNIRTHDYFPERTTAGGEAVN